MNFKKIFSKNLILFLLLLSLTSGVSACLKSPKIIQKNQNNNLPQKQINQNTNQLLINGQHQTTNNTQGAAQGTVVPPAKTDCTGELDTACWNTYRNEEYGFEVKFPREWTINDQYNLLEDNIFKITFNSNNQLNITIDITTDDSWRNFYKFATGELREIEIIHKKWPAVFFNGSIIEEGNYWPPSVMTAVYNDKFVYKITILNTDKINDFIKTFLSSFQFISYQEKTERETSVQNNCESCLQNLPLRPLCVIMSAEKIGGVDYNHKKNLFISKYENYFDEFEKQLKDLDKQQNLLLEEICQAGSNYAFLAFSGQDRDNITIGGFSEFKKQVVTRQLPKFDTYTIEGFIDNNSNKVIVGQGGGYAENSCHSYKEYFFNIDNGDFKKIKDCSGCDNQEDGALYNCSLDHRYSNVINGFDLGQKPVDEAEKYLLCNSKPKYSDMGGAIYPIKEEYKNLNYLGQLFTAQECGKERLNEFLIGDENKDESRYILGSTLRLGINPNNALINIFQDIGYTCVDNNKIEKECREWKLDKEVKVEKLLKIKDFIEYFTSDDCVNCG